MSLALAYQRRVLAEQEAAGARAVEAAALPYSPSEALNSPANARKHLKLQEVALDQDLERISAIKGLAGRQDLKRNELLPKYQPYIQSYCESDQNLPNRVLVQVMVWLFDTAQFEEGLELAEFAIEQGQQMPERFKRRDIQTFVADSVIEWANAEHDARRSPEPYLSQLLPQVDGEWDLTEAIPAKYHKLLGIRAMEAQDWSVAIPHFERATALYPQIGVGTRLENCRKALKKQADSGAS
ncbi:phage terminase small subunit [Pseudomonas sp. Irchel 3A18]|uniref:phage terminase small subunit n=1 Tax=Pseudomonas sp. Irchel 3A18 TaxID=2008905 RepID=UPI000BA4581A|nr:phage terminase small subunit [Pseudomonas sp. Irchel 3A18]